MSIASELAEVAKCPPKKGEDEQSYLKRLVTAVNALQDEEWKQISEKAQSWANEAIDAIEAKTDVPAPTGLEDVMKRTAEAAGKKPAAKKTAANGKAPTKAKAPATKKTAAKKSKGEAKVGGRPRFSDDATVRWKTKELPEGNRNKYKDKVKEGMKFGAIRKDKTLFRVTKYWRRKGFIELVGG